MKQHISISDLLELTEEQKQELRFIWIPKERDLAVATICSNAEDNSFDNIVFTVGKLECEEFETGRDPKSRRKRLSMVLRSLKLVDESFYENIEKNDDNVDELSLEYQAPDDYFDLSECLPLLSIGQMIEILNDHYFVGQDFSIDYNGQENLFRISLRNSILNDKDSDYTSHEVCDVLWKAVKTILK
ncbi:MAG: hypothetical protein Q8942_18405 [Bacillota bacterium]|nr:hypothetical protein [Bacillota bacterium]